MTNHMADSYAPALKLRDLADDADARLYRKFKVVFFFLFAGVALGIWLAIAAHGMIA